MSVAELVLLEAILETVTEIRTTQAKQTASLAAITKGMQTMATQADIDAVVARLDAANATLSSGFTSLTAAVAGAAAGRCAGPVPALVAGRLRAVRREDLRVAHQQGPRVHLRDAPARRDQGRCCGQVRDRRPRRSPR